MSLPKSVLKKKPLGKPTKWRARYVFQVYDLARKGLNNTRIAEVLGVNYMTFGQWASRKPILQLALREARKKEDGEGKQTFADFIYKQLPQDLREVWDKRKELMESPSGAVRWEAMLNEKGTKARQYLFLYALVSHSFNASEACRAIMVPKSKLDEWREKDLDFNRLVDEIEWHKGNFFESRLVKLVRQGEPNAVLFANKTFNKRRGYTGDQDATIHHEHTHSIISIDAILPMLSISARKEILEKWNAYREQLANGQKDGPVIRVTPERITNE